MTQWTAFVGFTGVVLSLFLVLARLSQGVVDDTDTDADGAASTAGDASPLVPPAAPGPGERPVSPVDHAASDPSADPESSAATADEPAPVDTDGAAGVPRVTDESSESGESDGPTDGRAVSPARGPDAPLVTETAAVDRSRRTAEPGDPKRVRGPGQQFSPGVLLANVALTQGLFGALVAGAAWYFEIPASALGLADAPVGGPTAVAVGLAFGLVLWLGNELASALADASGASYDEGLRTLLAPDSARGWALLLGATLPIIALVEEFLFRAAAIGATSAGLGVSPWALALVSSVAFALGHGAQGRVGVVVTGGLGFALAAGYVLTGSFVVVVVAHYLVNALEFGVHEGLGLPDPVWP